MQKTGASFHQLSLQTAQAHKEYFAALKLNEKRRDFFAELAEKSIAKQTELEAQDTVTFDEYLEAYFSY